MKMFEFFKLMFLNKKGDLEIDELGKLILGLILLIVLIVIITVVIKKEFYSAGRDAVGLFDLFK